MFIKPKERGSDLMGSGAFGARRSGGRTHKGIDLCASPGDGIYSHIDGVVTKIGFPYKQDGSTTKSKLKSALRYVEVTDFVNQKHRFFYVISPLRVGTEVEAGDFLGNCADLNRVFGKRMKNHVHYEVMIGSKYLDPRPFV